MKKQFFYAAMAIAFMASCTSDDTVVVDPVNPTPEEEKVALELGVATPAMTVGSRGTGMVGYVGTYNNSGKSSWDSQRLYLTMVNQKSHAEYTENGTAFFEGLEFRAPSATTGTDNNNGTIRIYTSGSYGTTTDGTPNATPEADKGILQYKYYPVTGEYTFYGFHADNAFVDGETKFIITAKTDQVEGTATVNKLTINGTQDILAGKTVQMATLTDNDTSIPADAPYANVVTDVNSYKELAAKQFSAKTARNNVIPQLQFNHTLARLQFFVKAGNGTEAALNYTDQNNTEQTRTAIDPATLTYGEWAETVTEDDGSERPGKYYPWKKYATEAIYVTGIKVLNMADEISLNLIEQSASSITASGANKEFTLMSTPEQVNNANASVSGWNNLTTKELQNLVPVAPTYSTTHSDWTTETSADLIGESIMFLPVEADNTHKKIQIEIQLGQCLVDTENEVTNEKTYYWDTPKPVILELDAEKIVLPNQTTPVGNDGKFEAGKSYNVYITIYGRERIEVSANLVPWVEGGNINTDIEEDYIEE